MPTRGRKQCRPTLDQFERRQYQPNTAAGTRPDALMDRAFNVDLTQTPQRQGGSSAVPQQPFQGLTLRRFDAHAGVERKAATVVAIRHRRGVVRLRHPAPGRCAPLTVASLELHFVE